MPRGGMRLVAALRRRGKRARKPGRATNGVGGGCRGIPIVLKPCESPDLATYLTALTQEGGAHVVAAAGTAKPAIRVIIAPSLHR